MANYGTIHLACSGSRQLPELIISFELSLYSFMNSAGQSKSSIMS